VLVEESPTKQPTSNHTDNKDVTPFWENPLVIDVIVIAA
jgi:hypothetical protein